MDEQPVTPQLEWAYVPQIGTTIRLAPGSLYRITAPAGWKIEEAVYGAGEWTCTLRTDPLPYSGGSGK